MRAGDTGLLCMYTEREVIISVAIEKRASPYYIN